MILKGIIFDLDGTLLNTLPLVRRSFQNTLLKYCGREFTDLELSALFGPSEDGIFKKLFPKSWDECLAFYLKEYDRMHPLYADPFTGIKEVLALLEARNIKLAIVSGKGQGSMDISLKHSDLRVFFDTVITGSEHQANKPRSIQKVLTAWDLPPENVAYVGDIAYDVRAAKEAGVIPISAIWAETAQVQKVLSMNPTYVFYDVKSFIEWIKNLGEPL